MSITEKYISAMNKLTKWRMIFASWQLGSRAITDPECRAVRDHREATMLMRAELNALKQILLQKNLCTQDEVMLAVTEECGHLEAAYEEFFPGARATEEGMDIDIEKARPWISKFPA